MWPLRSRKVLSAFPGGRLILLLGQRTESGGDADVTPELCGLVAYRESNLAIIRAGIAQDERIPPFIEYDPQYRPRKFSDPPQVPGTPGPYTSFPAQP